VDGQDGVADVIVLEVQGLHLSLNQPPLQVGQGLGQVGSHLLALGGQLHQDVQLLAFLVKEGEELELLVQLFLALLQGLGGFGIFPDEGRGQLALDGFTFSLFCR
jgi:hypothetical protein